MKMWSGRFRQPLDPQFERWQRSFDFDRRLLSYELAASGAHARALKNAGVLSADELISILEGLQQIGEMAAASKGLVEDDEAEDVHHFVEKQLVRGSAKSDTSCTAGAAATSRSPLTCASMCGRRSMSCGRN